MLGNFQQAALFCGPPRQPRSGGRPSCRRAPRRSHPHSALPLPPPPPTRLAIVTPSSTRAATPSLQDRPENPENSFGRDELFSAFDTIDTEKKGVLEDRELECILELLGISYAPVQFMLLLSKLDPDGKGIVGRERFVNFFVTASIVKPCSIKTTGKACNTKAAEVLPLAEVFEKDSLHSDVPIVIDELTADSPKAMETQWPTDEADKSKPASLTQSLVEQVHCCLSTDSDDGKLPANGADQQSSEIGSKQCHEHDGRRERRAQQSIQRLLKSQDGKAADPRIEDAAWKLQQISEHTSSAVLSWNRCLVAAWWSSTRLKRPNKTSCQTPEIVGLHSAPVVPSFCLESGTPGGSSCSSPVSHRLCSETQDVAQKAQPKVEISETQRVEPLTTPIVLQPHPSSPNAQTKRPSNKAGTVKRSRTDRMPVKNVTIEVALAKTRTPHERDSSQPGKGGAPVEAPPNTHSICIADGPKRPATAPPNTHSICIADGPKRPSTAPFKRQSICIADGPRRLSVAPCLSNHFTEKKLHAFDMRQQNARLSSAARSGAGRASSHGTSGGDSAVEEVEVELGFHIVDWSSQSPSHEAISLLQPHGKWESLSRNSPAVHNEYVVFGLHGNPSTVTGIEIAMNGSSTSPRRCRVQFSTKQVGPWHDAWTFQVQSANALTYRSQHKYGKLARAFKAAIVDSCGSEEQAWDYMDCNSTGKLSKHDFESAFYRMKKLFSSPGLNHMDPHKVFRDIDIDGKGEMLLEDLFKDDLHMPVAGFWRLLIVDNWGSPTTTGLSNPLRLFSTEAAEMTMGNGIFENQCKFLEEMVMASHPECLHLTEEQRMTRRLAREHKVSEAESELICTEFHRFDVDETNALERAEFDELVTKLQCLQSKGQTPVLPVQRLDFFWRQADSDQNGALKLEEFFLWYSVHNRSLSKY